MNADSKWRLVHLSSLDSVRNLQVLIFTDELRSYIASYSLHKPFILSTDNIDQAEQLRSYIIFLPHHHVFFKQITSLYNIGSRFYVIM